MARGFLCAGGDPGMTGCLECPLTRPVLVQSWCQTATDGAWYATTVLLSGHDRPLSPITMCPKAAWIRTRNSVDRGVVLPPPESAASSWRVLVMRRRPISIANSCMVKKSAMPGFVCTQQRPLTFVHGIRGRPVDHLPIRTPGGSSPGELRAGRMGHTANALPWPQTVLKRCICGVHASQSCNHRSLPVRSEK